MGEIKILLNQFTFVKKQKPVAWVDGFSIGAKKKKNPRRSTTRRKEKIPQAYSFRGLAASFSSQTHSNETVYYAV